jgi:hypothetical protein
MPRDPKKANRSQSRIEQSPSALDPEESKIRPWNMDAYV